MQDVSELITGIVERLKSVAGVEARVLGGSRARGSHIATSDVDLGIYYHPSAALDFTELARVAAEMDDAHREHLVTGIGGWGPWINGGGCCFRSIACLAQTLFALNEQYWMNEKGAVALAAGFLRSPAQFAERVALAFEQMDRSAQGISAGIETIEALVEECRGWVKAAAYPPSPEK